MARAVKAGYFFCFQRWAQLQRIDAVVFDRISRSHNLGLRKAPYCAQHVALHIERHGRGKALHVNFLGIQPHGLQKQLMARLVRETYHLILNGGAIPRANALDHPAVKRRAVQILPNDFVRFIRRIGQVAHGLIGRRALCFKRKGNDLLFAALLFQPGKIYRTAVNTGRRAGFEAL